ELQLVLTSERAREQQVADVGTRDQQDETDGSEQQEERPPHVADQRGAQGQRLLVRSLVLVRKLVVELPRDGRQLRLRTRERLTVAETPNPIDPPRLPLRRCG